MNERIQVGGLNIAGELPQGQISWNEFHRYIMHVQYFLVTLLIIYIRIAEEFCVNVFVYHHDYVLSLVMNTKEKHDDGGILKIWIISYGPNSYCQKNITHEEILTEPRTCSKSCPYPSKAFLNCGSSSLLWSNSWRMQKDMWSRQNAGGAMTESKILEVVIWSWGLL